MPLTSGTDEALAAPSLPHTHLQYAQLLRRIELFRGVDRVALAKLAAYLQPVSYPADKTIFRQGEAGDAFYLVAAGTVGVYVMDQTGTTEIQVRILGAGEPFGEMALLTDDPRTATVRAAAACEVLRLDRSAFLGLIREHPSVALTMAGTLSRRLAGMLNQAGPAAAMAQAHPAAAAESAAQRAAIVPRSAAGSWARWRPNRTTLALIAAAAIFALGWLVHPPHGLSATAWHGLIILLAALPPLVTDAMLEGVLALLLAGAWTLFGVTSAAVALSGFATPSWVLVIAVLIIGAAITQTGLLFRLALETIRHLGGGFIGEATALACAGQIFGPAVPNATSRIIIIAPMLRELIDALGYPAKSKAAAGLAMAVLIGFGQMAATTLTSGTTAVLVAAVLPAPARNDINWITWTVYGAPFNIILFVGVLGTILWHYRPAAGARPVESDARAKSLQLQRALLGPMSRDEKIALCVGIGLLIGFITQPLHHIDPGWVATIAIAVLSVTRVVTVNTLRAVNWNFALLFGVLISLATVFSHTGVDRWVAGGVAGVMGQLATSRIAFVVVLCLLCFAISFVVRWQAAAPLVTIALSPAASAAGIHPFIVGLIAVVACNGFFLPYQSTTYLALEAGTGRALFTPAQAFPTAIAFAIWTVIASVLSVPIWHLMGLI